MYKAYQTLTHVNFNCIFKQNSMKLLYYRPHYLLSVCVPLLEDRSLRPPVKTPGGIIMLYSRAYRTYLKQYVVFYPTFGITSFHYFRFSKINGIDYFTVKPKKNSRSCKDTAPTNQVSFVKKCLQINEHAHSSNDTNA